MTAEIIIQLIALFFLLCISLSSIFVALALRSISFYQRRIMETFIVIQMQHSEANEHVQAIAQYIYGIDDFRLLMPKRAREAGDK